MNAILSVLKTTFAAAVLAGSLAAAAPAMAQSGEPSSNFSIGAPSQGQNQGQGQMQMSPNAQSEGMIAPEGSNSQRGKGFGYDPGYNPGFNLCLSNREVIRGIRDYGFTRVQVTDSSRRTAEVLGRWGRWDYLMSVNKCTGDVRIIDRFRRGAYNGNGFGLQFNFN